MTNLEKYPNTADAVKAWNEYGESGNLNISFENWLGLDYIEPPSLLEAAKAAKDWMAGGAVIGVEGPTAFGKLKAAIATEESRPKRNFERFATAKEASETFKKMCCRDNLCRGCRFVTNDKDSFEDIFLCVVRWLYSSNPKLLSDDGAEREGRAEEKSEEAD